MRDQDNKNSKESKLEKKVLNYYLGNNFIKKDPRKEELLADCIDIVQWGRNIHLAVKLAADNIDLDNVLLEDEHIELIESATPLFLSVYYQLTTLRIALDYPEQLYKGMSWFVAAYPDVIDYFYPCVKYYPYDKPRIEAEKQAADFKRKVSYKLLEAVEDEYLEKTGAPAMTAFEYFVALKDHYKRSKKLLLAKPANGL